MFEATDKLNKVYRYKAIDTIKTNGYENGLLYRLYNIDMDCETIVEKEWFRQRKIVKLN